jgi:hypothetical protein
VEYANSTSLRTGVGAQPFISGVGCSGRKSAAVRYLRFTIRQPPLDPARIGSLGPVSRHSPMVMAMSSRTTASWFAWFGPAAERGRTRCRPSGPVSRPVLLHVPCVTEHMFSASCRQVLRLLRLAMSASQESRAGEGILAFSRRSMSDSTWHFTLSRRETLQLQQSQRMTKVSLRDAVQWRAATAWRSEHVRRPPSTDRKTRLQSWLVDIPR